MGVFCVCVLSDYSLDMVAASTGFDWFGPIFRRFNNMCVHLFAVVLLHFQMFSVVFGGLVWVGFGWFGLCAICLVGFG